VFFIIPIIISDLFQHNADLPLWQDWILESSFVPGSLLLRRIARAFVVLDDRNGSRSSSFPVLADLTKAHYVVLGIKFSTPEKASHPTRFFIVSSFRRRCF
jgi:hypothetical protein